MKTRQRVVYRLVINVSLDSNWMKEDPLAAKQYYTDADSFIHIETVKPSEYVKTRCFWFPLG